MAMAKLSVLLLMLRLSPQIWLRRATHIIMIALAVWVVFSGIGLPLQCGTPGTTEYSAERCSLKGVLWYPVLLFNILTDFAVALLFIPVVLKLQMSKPRQTTVCLLFGSCIVYV